MWQLTFIIFILAFCIFAGIMLREPRTLWSGVSFFLMLMWLALFVLFFFSQYSNWLGEHRAVLLLMVALFILASLFILAFPVLLMILFFVEGLKIIRHEGKKPSNLLSLLFSVLLCAYLFVWPIIGSMKKDAFSTRLYMAVTLFALYLLALMAMYALSAILNLVHLKKKRRLNYIVVLGCGIRGREVTPLLASRIDRGIGLLQHNPHAQMILSGGQGPGEEIPESEAMAAYAVQKGVDRNRIIMEQKSVSTEENLLFSKELMNREKPKIAIVTTAYHVFRALILARKQGMKCVGFGAKTKWYFTLNALIREFVGYLSLTWKRHALVMAVLAWGVMMFL